MDRKQSLFLLFAATLLMASPARAFTLDIATIGGTTVTTTGWGAVTSLAYNYDYSACPTGMSADTINGPITTAFNLWNTVPTSNLKLSVGVPTTADFASATAAGDAGTPGSPVIFCDQNFSNDTQTDGNFVAGVGEAFFDTTGKVYFAMIVLNAETGKNANIQGFDPTKLTIILAHETGHTLGLGHSSDPNALMYYDASAKTMLGLAQDDLDGITYLYPRKEPSSGSGAFGCGSLAIVGAANGGAGRDGGGGAEAETLALFLALAAIWLGAKRRPRISLA